MAEGRGFWGESSIVMDGYHFLGPPIFVLACKLKALKEDLKQWNKQELGMCHLGKKSLLTELLGLDLRDGEQALTHDEKTRKTAIKVEID